MKYDRFSFLGTSEDWAVDSGASQHMTSTRSLFCEFNACKVSDIIVANGEKLYSQGEGTVKMKIVVDGNKSLDVVLENVLYVPNLNGNLMSVKQLVEKGYGVVFEESGCHLTKDGYSLLVAKYEAGLFKIKRDRRRKGRCDNNPKKMMHIGKDKVSKGNRVAGIRNPTVSVNRNEKFLNEKKKEERPKVDTKVLDMEVDEEVEDDIEMEVQAHEEVDSFGEGLSPGNESTGEEDVDMYFNGDFLSDLQEPENMNEEPGRSGRANAGDSWVYVATSEDGTFESGNFDEIVNCKDKKKWMDSMKEELKSVEENAKSATFRLLLSVAGVRGYFVQQFGVKSMYRLKQKERNWNKTLHKIFIDSGFRRSSEDRCLYILTKKQEVCYVLVHVDDLIVASNSQELIQEVYGKVSVCCELKILESVKKYLEIDVHRSTEDTVNEFVALCKTKKEMMWLKRLCRDFVVDVDATNDNFADSQNCMKIVTNDGFSDRSRHIDTKYNYTKDRVTKPLGPVKRNKLRKKAGLEVYC